MWKKQRTSTLLPPLQSQGQDRSALLTRAPSSLAPQPEDGASFFLIVAEHKKRVGSCSRNGWRKSQRRCRTEPSPCCSLCWRHRGCTRNTCSFLSDLTPILGTYIDARQPQRASEGLGGRGGLSRSKPTDRCYRRATIAARSRPLWFDGQELIIQPVRLVLSKISKVFQPSLLCPIVSPLGSVQILRREV
jgi:hypothetical protein